MENSDTADAVRDLFAEAAAGHEALLAEVGAIPEALLAEAAAAQAALLAEATHDGLPLAEADASPKPRG